MSILEKQENIRIITEGLTELNALQGTSLILSRSILIVIEALSLVKPVESPKKVEDKEYKQGE